MEVLRYTRGSSLAMESSSLRKLVHLTRDTSYTAVHCLVLATVELQATWCFGLSLPTPVTV